MSTPLAWDSGRAAMLVRTLFIAVLGAVTLICAAFARDAQASPTPPHVITAFPQRDFVSAESGVADPVARAFPAHRERADHLRERPRHHGWSLHP
jgi:hypothetical protein